ncbi:A24 family peptidase (plasmid) [Kitasatospora sp. NBC_00374]|uniref:A24 family peptidase n=1 Tax=Kitasatospora sp. NBC_00374 TaxID=2975964 RepID=UPI002F90D545
MPHSPAVVVVALLLAAAVGALVLRPAAFAFTRPEGTPVPEVGCPDCGSRLLGRGAVPGAYRVLVLRRCCVACRSSGPGGMRRLGPPPLVPEVLAAAGTAAMLAGGASGVVLVVQLWLVAVGVVLLITDFAEHRLPNRLTALAAGGVGVLLLGAALTGSGWGALVRAVVAAVAVGGWFFVLALFGQGLGDAKLAPSYAALLGWQSWIGPFYGLLLACALGVAQWVVMKVAFGATRKTELALGPALVVGTLSVSALLG